MASASPSRSRRLGRFPADPGDFSRSATASLKVAPLQGELARSHLHLAERHRGLREAESRAAGPRCRNPVTDMTGAPPARLHRTGCRALSERDLNSQHLQHEPPRIARGRRLAPLPRVVTAAARVALRQAALAEKQPVLQRDWARLAHVSAGYASNALAQVPRAPAQMRLSPGISAALPQPYPRAAATASRGLRRARSLVADRMLSSRSASFRSSRAP